MQENNFEKKVKQKLDELLLSPSEPVWQKVEAAIQKKRRRRLALLWLPLLFAAGGALWWMLAVQQPAKQMHTDKAPVETNTTFSKPHAAPQADVSAENNAGEPTGNATNQLEPNTVTVKPVGTNNSHQSTRKIAYASKGKKAPARYQWKQTAVESKTEREISPTTTNRAATGNTAAFDKVNREPAPALADTTAQSNAVKDSAQNTVVPPADSIEKAVPQKIVKLQAKRKLQWHVVSRIGGSNTVAPVSFVSGMKTLQEDRQPGQSYGGGNFFPGPNADSQGWLQPVAPVTGLHLSVGATMKKNVRTRSFITAGLQYSYYSNRISVGERLPNNFLVGSLTNSPGRMDESGSGTGYLFTGTSRSSRNNQFTNAYHFIELPLGFEYRLLKKLPLQLEHGVAISQLVSSKALQYDGSTNVYYQSKSALRKTSVSLFTSMNYTVWNGPSVSLQAGPHVQYGMQSFYKSGSNSRLLSGGIALSMGF
jgi:hypothetical protein